MKVNSSALKQGVDERDIRHAAEHRANESEADANMPSKTFVLGFDRHGRLLELVIVNFDGGNQLVIHAMKARRSCDRFLIAEAHRLMADDAERELDLGFTPVAPTAVPVPAPAHSTE